MLILLEGIHGLLDLRAQIGAMEALLVHLASATLAVPPQLVHAALRPRLLQHDAHRVGEADRVVRHVGRQQEHLALVDVDVAEGLGGGVVLPIDDLEQHAPLVLVEPLGRGVDVVVGARVGPADDHDGHVLVGDAVVVDGRLEEMGVLGEPGRTSVSV